MIWTDNFNQVPSGSVQETVSFDGQSYQVYKSGSYIAPHEPKIIAEPAPRKSARGRVAPSTLMGEVSAPRADPSASREAFRKFMISHQLRATEWAKLAGVPSSQVYAFLTGKLRALSDDAAQKLARAARVRVEDMFRK